MGMFMSIKVHFIASRQDPIIDYLLTPVRINKNKLLELGYDVKIFYKYTHDALSCDVLALLSKTILRSMQEKTAVCLESGPTVAFLKKARQHANKIIWFDTSDSTSVTHFELLPFVDLYLKKQIFKDKNMYQKEFYGGRIFSDFYNKKFGIEDKALFNQFYPLSSEFFDKVQLSWNIGLGDMYGAFTKKADIRRRFSDYLKVSYKIPIISPQMVKNTDIFLRTSANLGRNSVSFHRQEMVRRLSCYIDKRKDLNGSINGDRLSTKDFRAKLSDTKILPSPFGWGEIGVRDYEAFIYGALLFKPNMDHMLTWPNIFIDGVTYVSIDWGFEKMDEQIDELLFNNLKRIDIATYGQKAYLDTISQAGMNRFCNWFIQQINL